MRFSTVLSVAALAYGAAAQFVSYSDSNKYSISVNIPANTASSKSGSIYMQISAPSNTQWAGFGIGNQMAGATMFVLYGSGSQLTLSTRYGLGEIQPLYNSTIQATLMDGSVLNSDGSFLANIRCDSCIGALNPTDTSSDWIMAYKTGSVLGSTAQTATIQQHGINRNFNLNLVSGTGGSSTDPFAQSGSATTSASASGSSSSSTGSSSATYSPIASSNPNSSAGDQDSNSNSVSNSPLIHGVIMSVVFLGLFPFFALTLYLPTTKKVRFIHAPLQLMTVLLMIAGMALGIYYGTQINEVDEYHQIIGYIVVGYLVLVQPVLGLYQHLRYHKTGDRSVMGHVHRWLGRAILLLGIINGGIGWNIAGGGTTSYIAYGVVAGIVGVIYISIVLFFTIKDKKSKGGSYSGHEHDKHLSESEKGSTGSPVPTRVK